jgi:hypothetical protein
MRACLAGIAQLVERNLAKVEVASSSLVSRSKIFKWGKSCFPLVVCSQSDGGTTGEVAEWSCSGLQSRGRRFDSDPRLQLKYSSPLKRGLFYVYSTV